MSYGPERRTIADNIAQVASAARDALAKFNGFDQANAVHAFTAELSILGQNTMPDLSVVLEGVTPELKQDFNASYTDRFRNSPVLQQTFPDSDHNVHGLSNGPEITTIAVFQRKSLKSSQAARDDYSELKATARASSKDRLGTIAQNLPEVPDLQAQVAAAFGETVGDLMLSIAAATKLTTEHLRPIRQGILRQKILTTKNNKSMTYAGSVLGDLTDELRAFNDDTTTYIVDEVVAKLKPQLKQAGSQRADEVIKAVITEELWRFEASVAEEITFSRSQLAPDHGLPKKAAVKSVRTPAPAVAPAERVAAEPIEETSRVVGKVELQVPWLSRGNTERTLCELTTTEGKTALYVDGRSDSAFILEASVAKSRRTMMDGFEELLQRIVRAAASDDGAKALKTLTAGAGSYREDYKGSRISFMTGNIPEFMATYVKIVTAGAAIGEAALEQFNVSPDKKLVILLGNATKQLQPDLVYEFIDAYRQTIRNAIIK